MDFEDPRVSVELLDELVSLGLDNELFRKLHHARNYKNTIGAHRSWCSKHPGRFEPDGTNARTARRFAAALEARRAGLPWPAAIATARARVPFDGPLPPNESTPERTAIPITSRARREELRPRVLERMRRLVDSGLGWFDMQEPQRTTFVLDPTHPAAASLSARTSAKNFVREDEGSLLIRDATPALESLLPGELGTRRLPSAKGLEFRWSNLDSQAVDALFDSIHALAFAPVDDPVEQETMVAKLLARPMPIVPPEGQAAPRRVSRQSDGFARSPYVVAWVLAHAAGNCERCGGPAPFLRANGQPYLEVHHVRWLAEGGPDTVVNAVALCPTCHRLLHHAANARAATEELYTRVARLRR
jgi:hypothetical protein